MTVNLEARLVADDESRLEVAEMLALDAAEGMVVGFDRAMSYTSEVYLFTARQRETCRVPAFATRLPRCTRGD